MEGQSQFDRFHVNNKSRLASSREWLLPFALIVMVSSLTFLGTSLLDFEAGPRLPGFWSTLLLSDATSTLDDVGNLAEVLIGVLGLTLTVVAIVVQLAAQRYTPKLVDLFLADRVNALTFLGMVFATVFCIWIIYSSRTDYVPVYGKLLLMIITTVLLTLLIPYFRYVFKFLTPSNIIETIEANLARMVDASVKMVDGIALEKQKSLVANGLEQVTDIALSAVTQMDRNVALMSINTLSAILRNYTKNKTRLKEAWFRPNPSQFIAISSEFFDEIAERRLWVEARGFMDMELIFGLALRTMPDANSAIGANTRELCITAIENEDAEAAYLCVEYFNTFLRRSINDNNVRAVFSLLYQYRRLAEYLLPKQLQLGEEIAGFINYYGQQAMRVGMPFLKVAAAMDIGILLRHGYALNVSPMDRMLEDFLSIGESPDLHDIAFAHEGVRKAHVILAAHLMAQGKSSDHLQRISDSLRRESPAWLENIKTALLNVTKQKFWEITDRGGINFEYIEPKLKDALSKFYEEYLVLPAKKPRKQARKKS
ncbi:MAG: DUF2254 domain-containing protein [SAR324 cluster bacterium]|nr:DUF2254 domain-containing protein [SAR324 cluster bacterium]